MYKYVVFLVDDDEDDREIFREALQTMDEHISFLTASDGVNALEQISNPNFIQPDIIFMDLNMPRMDGKQLIAAIKKHNSYKNIPVIVYSTSSNPSDINHTLSNGAAAYMVKHSSFKQLCADLRIALKEHLPMF